MRWVTFLSWLFLGSLASAQERTHTVVPDDYASINSITEIAVSPDGKQVAYALATWDKSEDNRKTDLWIVSTTGQRSERRVTMDRANDRHIKWSVNRDCLYFLGNRKRTGETKPPYDGSTQVWRVKLQTIVPEDRETLEGSKPRAITKVDGGVSGFDYVNDTIYYTKDITQNDQDDFAKLRAQYKAEYGHGIRKVSELHSLSLITWRTEKLIDDKRYIRSFAVAPTGKRIAMISAFDDSVVKSEGESRVDVWEAGKTVTPPTEVYRKNKANSPFAWLENLTWNADGTRYAFTAIHDAFPAEVIVGAWDTKEWKVSRIDRKVSDWELIGYGRALGQPFQFLDGNSYYVATERHGKVSAGFGTSDTVVELPNDKNIVAFESANKGKDREFAMITSSPSEFASLTYLGKKPEPLMLVDPNPHTASWKLPKIKHITWKAPDGATVGGVLELPPDYQQGDKLPLVVAIHGGPTVSTKAEMNFDPHNGRLYFATAGYAVLCPNYRGSTGYGDKFVTDLIGKENDIEVKDILAGIDHLVKEGIVDGKRVGCMGWSNGGYLTNCLITLKNSPIKAASSGAGIVDTVSEWGFNDEPAYPIVFKKGLPWEQAEMYKKTSPTYGLGNVKTPTLIHVGGGDERCPPGHSRMLYRALKENLNVPTELIVYPGEPHGLTKLSHRKAKMEWDLAWFEKYLKNAK